MMPSAWEQLFLIGKPYAALLSATCIISSDGRHRVALTGNGAVGFDALSCNRTGSCDSGTLTSVSGMVQVLAEEELLHAQKVSEPAAQQHPLKPLKLKLHLSRGVGKTPDPSNNAPIALHHQEEHAQAQASHKYQVMHLLICIVKQLTHAICLYQGCVLPCSCLTITTIYLPKTCLHASHQH